MNISVSLTVVCFSVTFLLAAQTQAPTPVVVSIPGTGDREVTTFKLFKDKQPTAIGSIKVMIRSLDAKAQKYSVDISVGTRRMEKKDLYAGEPIVFYAANDEQASEFLVRQVFDDRLEGRLISPRPLPPALPPK